ncbi:MAG: calcium-binding protein, partial [Pseudomonadota bacterium]
MVAWSEQFGDGVPDNGEDIVAKIYNADGFVELDSFGLNFEWVSGDQFAFDIAPTYDGLVHVYGDEDFLNTTLRIERSFVDQSYLFGTLTGAGSFGTPQIVANLTPENDDIFIVYENGQLGSLDAIIIDENDNFSNSFSILAPNTVADRLRVDDAVVLSNGSFASLLWNGGANYVSVVSEDGTFLSQTFIATNSSPDQEVARDLASLAGGGFVVVGEKFTGFNEIFARIYDNDGQFVTEVTPIEIDGYRVDQARVAALPDGGFVIMFEAGNGRFHAQLFDANGESETNPVLIAEAGFFGDQPDLSVTSDGRVVFVWSGEEGTGLNTEIFSSVWDPRGDVINPDDYGQTRANFVATNVITTGTGDAIVLEGANGDVILAQGGNDTIYTSGAGDFWGGGGNDTFILSSKVPDAEDQRYIDGEDGDDMLDASGLTSDFLVNLATGDTNLSNQGIFDVEHVVSGSGNDEIIGTDANNDLDGAAGDDTLTGGAGDDTLTGGAGDDIFVKRPGESDDMITDFETGAEPSKGDKIDVSAYGLSYNQIVFETEPEGLRVRLGTDSILLQGITAPVLDRADFIGLVQDAFAETGTLSLQHT